VVALSQNRGVVVRASATLSKHVSQEFIVNQFAERSRSKHYINLQISTLSNFQIIKLLHHIPHIVLQHQYTFLLLGLYVDKFKAGVDRICFAGID
jgi:hypothetical protein